MAFHRSYPLFATSSDDCTSYVFHGMVYSDLNQDPLLVPLEILRGHSRTNGRGKHSFRVFFPFGKGGWWWRIMCVSTLSFIVSTGFIVRF